MPSVPVALADGKMVRLKPDARDRHMHVLGLPGMGKSYFLENLVRNDIIAGHGVCVIDPHGTLYNNLVQWITSEKLERVRTIHLLNPSDQTYTFGFNPLCLENGTRLEYRVDAMVDACIKVWGGEKLTDTPRLAKCLTAVFHTLAANKLSLAEARYLTNTQFRDAAYSLLERIENEEYKALWLEFLSGFKPQTFTEYFESTMSRLLPFVGNPVIREIVGQTDNLINFRECMDRGHVVLVNLRPSGEISASAARLLGALITNDLYTTAFSRDEKTAKRRPFYCYIDECGRFLTEDIVNSLDETRKFGLHMVLSHQRINQLTEYGDNFYNAVMAGAQLKVMFRPGDEETADIMSRHFFRTSFDLELPKRSMDKPFVVGYDTVWFESETISGTDISGASQGDGAGAGIGSSMSQIYDSQGMPIGGYVAGDSHSSSSFSTSSRFDTVARTHSQTRAEGLKPVIEWLPTELYKLDELIHLGMIELLKLPKRTAWVGGAGLAPFKIETSEIKPGMLLPQFVPNRVAKINEHSTAVSTRKRVRDAMALRAFALEHADDEPVTGDDAAF